MTRGIRFELLILLIVSFSWNCSSEDEGSSEWPFEMPRSLRKRNSNWSRGSSPFSIVPSYSYEYHTNDHGDNYEAGDAYNGPSSFNQYQDYHQPQGTLETDNYYSAAGISPSYNYGPPQTPPAPSPGTTYGPPAAPTTMQTQYDLTTTKDQGYSPDVPQQQRGIYNAYGVPSSPVVTGMESYNGHNGYYNYYSGGQTAPSGSHPLEDNGHHTAPEEDSAPKLPPPPPPPPTVKGSIDYILIPLILIGISGPIFVVLYVVLGAFEAKLAPIPTKRSNENTWTNTIRDSFFQLKPSAELAFKAFTEAMEKHECQGQQGRTLCHLEVVLNNIGLKNWSPFIISMFEGTKEKALKEKHSIVWSGSI